MNRLLLTLLALLTGLTLQAAPVHARMTTGSETEVNASDCARGVARGATAQSSQAPVSRAERRDRDISRGRPPSRPRVYIPAVQFGPDRAFE
jgi:hypothetical protein